MRVLPIIFPLLFATDLFARAEVVYLSRHGETFANREKILIGQKLDPKVDLTEKGRAQAESLASLLADAGIERIYVSRLVRTQQTATPLAWKLNLIPRVRSYLDEMHFDLKEGARQDSLETTADLKRADADCDYRVGEGESRKEVHARVEKMVAELKRKGAPKTVLLIGSFGPVRELLSLVTGLSCQEAGKIFPANTDVFRMTWKKEKLERLEVSRDRKPFVELTVEALKSLGHLPADTPSAKDGRAPTPIVH
jgi:probable phosphoglycerate mutase